MGRLLIGVLSAGLLCPAFSSAADFRLPSWTLKDVLRRAAPVGVRLPRPVRPVAVRATELRVKLTASPRRISAGTGWSSLPTGMRKAVIGMAVESGDGGLLKDVVLEIADVRGGKDYSPGSGRLRREPRNRAKWIYMPFEEPRTEKHPKTVDVRVIPKYKGKTCGEPVLIRVQPVFAHLTGVHAHGPGQRFHMPQPDDYELAWKYARWKYGIDTSDLTGIRYAPDIGQMGLTNMGAFGVGRYCRLGQTAFLSENLLASVLGHENVHGGQGLLTFIGPTKYAEIPAYKWEVDNAGKTGISESYLEECKAWLRYFQGRGPKPDF